MKLNDVLSVLSMLRQVDPAITDDTEIAIELVSAANTVRLEPYSVATEPVGPDNLTAEGKAPSVLLRVRI